MQKQSLYRSIRFARRRATTPSALTRILNSSAITFIPPLKRYITFHCLSSFTKSIISPTLQQSVWQIRANVSIETSSPLDNLAIVADDAPIARRSSVLFMSLSINSFQSFLYETLTTIPSLVLRISYHISVYDTTVYV